MLSITRNHYTFDGMETLIQNNNIDDLWYYSERTIYLHQTSNTLAVYAGGTLSNNTYKWFRNGSLAAIKQGDSTFKPTQTGNYTVQVTNSIATKLTLYSDTVTFSTLTAVQQNNIAVVETKDKIYFSVYPNPAKTTATITFNATGNCTVKLTDVSGKILQIKTITATKDKNILQLDISRYAAGVYFITITNEKNEAQTLRLNKE